MLIDLSIVSCVLNLMCHVFRNFRRRDLVVELQIFSPCCPWLLSLSSNQSQPSQDCSKSINSSQSSSKSHANTSSRCIVNHENKPTSRSSSRRQIISFGKQRATNRRCRASDILRCRRGSGDSVRRPNQSRRRSSRLYTLIISTLSFLSSSSG